MKNQLLVFTLIVLCDKSFRLKCSLKNGQILSFYFSQLHAKKKPQKLKWLMLFHPYLCFFPAQMLGVYLEIHFYMCSSAKSSQKDEWTCKFKKFI